MDIKEGEIYGNMSESQLFEMLMKFSHDCQCCKVAHHECRRVPHCEDCELGFWVRHLSKHFGVSMTVG